MPRLTIFRWFLLMLPPLCVLSGASAAQSRTTSGGIAAPSPERLVAEAPIWGANNGFKGYSFLAVTIQGHAATLVIDLYCTTCDLSLSTAALAKLGVAPLPATATSLDHLTIGSDVQRHVPLALISKPAWHVPGPPQLPPVVGLVGVHFLTTHYDLLYDYPNRRVQLYAWSAQHVPPQAAWLPPGFTKRDCGRLLPIPPGAGTFTGVAMQVDGHPVTGVFEMGPFYPKMDSLTFNLLGLPATSLRVTPATDYESDNEGHPLQHQVEQVHLAIGADTFWVGSVQVFPDLHVDGFLAPGTPVMLANLNTLQSVRLFNAVSSGQVCVSAPGISPSPFDRR